MFVEFLSSPAFQISFVLLLVAIVFFGFIREKLPADVIAFLAMGALMLTGILSVKDALGVFSNPAPITIAAMFVLSAALERTGVIGLAGRAMSHTAQRYPPAVAMVALVGAVIVLSAFINNTPVVVILIPVAIQLSQTLNISASKLLIPLSFASIFGGTTTLIGTSTNLLVDGVAQSSGLEPFGMFEISLVGLIMAAVGAAYLAVAGPRLLPDRDTLAAMLPSKKERRFIAQVLVPIDSPLIGKPLSETGLSRQKGFAIIDVLRHNVSMRHELKNLTIEAGDRIVVRSPVSEMLAIREAGDVALGAEPDGHAFEPLESSETVMMEGVIGPQSRLIGRRLIGAGLVRLYGVYPLAVHRRGENLAEQRDEIRFDVGDTVLLEGPPAGMRRLFDDGMLSSLTETSERAVRRNKAWIAVTAVLSVMVLAALNVLPIAGLALIAAGLVVALGCLDHQEAYQAIRWDIMILIFGMLAVGLAMEQTGAAALIVSTVGEHIGQFGPLAVLALIYIITSFLTEIMSNNAAAILLTPIAIGLADQLGVDARPLVVAVMFAASASFATPIGYQTNTLVYTAGGYRFSDFMKIGIPLNILMFFVAMATIPLVWPL